MFVPYGEKWRGSLYFDLVIPGGHFILRWEQDQINKYGGRIAYLKIFSNF